MSKVSVIVPIYNASAFLTECLNSVCQQTYRELDIILLNDGSTDDSEKIAKSYTEKDARFRLFSHENQGLGYTRNRGIRESRGEYLFFLDSDDRIPQHAIESLVKSVQECSADLGAGKVLRFNKDRSYVPVRHNEIGLYNQNRCTSALKEPSLLQDSIACNKLWKKSFIEKHDLFFEEGRLYEDLLFTMKGTVLAQTIGVTSSAVYHWRVRDEVSAPSITQEQMKLQNTLDRLYMLARCHEWLQQHAGKELQTEYDLKGLLDVLRLHVTKYALVSEDEREEWMKAVNGYFSRLPSDVYTQLPSNEQLLAELVQSGNTTDLLLLSQALQGTETQQIVKKDAESLMLKGTKDYNVSAFFKTEAIIRHASISSGGQFILTFFVRLPKASAPETVTLEMVNRKNKKKVSVLNQSCNVKNPSAVYPYDEQEFTVLTRMAGKFHGSDDTYDLYVTDGSDRKKARVRLYDHSLEKWKISVKGYFIELYGTNRGNASVRLKKKNLRNTLKKWFES